MHNDRATFFVISWLLDLDDLAMKNDPSRRQFLGSIAAVLLAEEMRAATTVASVGWTVYGGDQEATHYSPLTQINRDKVSGLRPAWIHEALPDAGRYRGSVECTPLAVD